MSDLHTSAAEAGLQRDWHDANGHPQQIEDGVLDAILARLDSTGPDVPFLSAEAGSAVSLPHGLHGTAQVLFEDGSTAWKPIEDGRIAGIDTIGYHQLIVGDRALPLAIAPPRCPQFAGRGWGASIQIPSLRGTRPSAYGDLGTLAEAATAFGRAGASALAISPTHALYPSDPARFSPYSPSTRLFHNVLLADPTLIGAPPPPVIGEELIDWRSAAPTRLHHLRATFDGLSDDLHAAVAAFRHQRGATLEAHARFDALHATFGGGGWRDWPDAYRDPSGEAVTRFAAEHADRVTFYAFLQWLTDLSLAAAQRAARETMAIGLIADLAVGMDSGGSHGWSRRDELLTGLSIGAPPDHLGPEGQTWGITALDPFALARTGFRPFIETIRASLAHAGGIRIDHALGFERLWVVPEGAPASAGAYLTMPAAHLKRIVAIEAHRADAIVIAEDLGTIPPGLRDDLSARGMLGMRVLLFERDWNGAFIPPDRWDRETVAMTGTHDTPTIAGWWSGRDIAWGRQLGRAVPHEAEAWRAGERASLWAAVGGSDDAPGEPPLDTILAAVSTAPAPLAIFPLEDIVGIVEQPNIPGTIEEHPNWRRRMPGPAAEMLTRPDVARRAAQLTRARPG